MLMGKAPHVYSRTDNSLLKQKTVVTVAIPSFEVSDTKIQSDFGSLEVLLHNGLIEFRDAGSHNRWLRNL